MTLNKDMITHEALANTPSTRSGRLLAAFERRLARPAAPWILLLIAALLTCTSLTNGYTSDDYELLAAERGAPIAMGRPLFDLFDFATGRPADAERLRDAGVLSWWIDPTTRIHFLRPLASVTHTLDGGAPMLEHAHNVVWYLLAIAALWLVLSRSEAPRGVAAFGLLLFAVDDLHGATVGWIANRSALMAAAFGFATLWAHDKKVRDGWRAGAIVAPLLFATALASAEAGIGALGYLVAHALVRDRRTARERLFALAPYAAVVAVYGVLYATGSFGVRNATQYVDPVGEPLRFGRLLLERLPAFLWAMIGGLPSDAAMAYATIHPALPYVMAVVGLVAFGLFVGLLVPLLRRDREITFWLLGAVLATLPLCAGFASDRVLLVPSAGIAVVIARLAFAVMRDANLYASKVSRVLGRLATGALLVAALPLSALLLPARAHAGDATRAPFTNADTSLPSGAASADATVVLVNPPVEPLVLYAHYARAARGAPSPGRTRVLATSGGRALQVERVDAHTIRIRSEAGLLSREIDMMRRRPGRDLPVGATVRLPDLEVTIEAVTADGRPMAALYRFERALDDPELVWRQWQGDRFEGFTPPATGTTTTLPAIDVVKLFTGGLRAKDGHDRENR